MNILYDYLKKILPEAAELHDILPETYEIRIKSGAPVYFFGSFGRAAGSRIYSAAETEKIFTAFCDGSVYSFENEIKNGFLPLPGGGRVGVGASAVIKNGEFFGIKNITSLCVRIPHEILGCAEEFKEAFISGGVLVAGPPGCGKTTLLRDSARLLSNGGRRVCVVDERNEISGMYLGAQSFSLGNMCDVLSFFRKDTGILYAVRALSPEYIVCDEAGTAAESRAMAKSMLSGCNIISSVHLSKIEDILKREASRTLIESGAFENVIFLQNHKGRLYKTEELYETFRNNSYKRRYRVFGGGAVS